MVTDITAKKAPTEAAPIRSAAAAAKIPELYLVLGEAYDRASGGYKPGWSDERVAKEVGGISIEFVCARREMDFGPAAPPVTVGDVIAHLASVRSLVSGLSSALEGVKAELVKAEEAAAKVSAGR